MTTRQTKKWQILSIVQRRGRTEILVCASPKATNVDLVTFTRAKVPSRALCTDWTVHRSPEGEIARCGITRGFRHYTLTTPEKESTR